MTREERGMGRPGTFGGLEELAVYVRQGKPVPQDLADWFCSAVEAFIDDRGPPKKLEALLGLSFPGKAHARLRWEAEGNIELLMTWAQFFHDRGATIPQACAMAQGLSGPSDRPLALDTVITHYRRRKMGAGIEQRRAALMQRTPCTAVPGVFEMIADPPGAYTEIRDGKARILATIARHGYKP